MTLLFAVDLDEPVELIRSIEAFADKLGADLLVVHVEQLEVASPAPLDPVGGFSGLPAYAVYDADLIAELHAAHEHAFTEFVKNFQRPVRAALRSGDPADVIVDDAAEMGADMIVLGKRKHGLIERVFVGSVATEVARRATLPVLLFPIAEEEKAR